jgi:hypothetical protein
MKHVKPASPKKKNVYHVIPMLIEISPITSVSAIQDMVSRSQKEFHAFVNS